MIILKTIQKEAVLYINNGYSLSVYTILKLLNSYTNIPLNEDESFMAYVNESNVDSNDGE